MLSYKDVAEALHKNRKCDFIKEIFWIIFYFVGPDPGFNELIDDKRYKHPKNKGKYTTCKVCGLINSYWHAGYLNFKVLPSEEWYRKPYNTCSRRCGYIDLINREIDDKKNGENICIKCEKHKNNWDDPSYLEIHIESKTFYVPFCSSSCALRYSNNVNSNTYFHSGVLN